jgi:predicted nucleic acid-binding protein
MAQLLLDSCVVIDVLRQRGARHIWLQAQVAAEHVLYCSVLTITEVLAGMCAHEQLRTQALLAGLASLVVTHDIAAQAGLITQECRQRGITLSLTDAIIAATAIAHDLVLATDNRKDFPMTGLKLMEI